MHTFSETKGSSLQDSITTDPASVTSSMFQGNSNQLFYFTRVIEPQDNVYSTANTAAPSTSERESAQAGQRRMRGTQSSEGAESLESEPSAKTPAPDVTAAAAAARTTSSTSNDDQPVSAANICDVIKRVLSDVNTAFDWTTPVRWSVEHEFILRLLFSRRFSNEEAFRFIQRLPATRLEDFLSLSGESLGCFGLL